MKAMVTWLGEDDDHPNGNGPRYNEWNGIRFKIDEPREIADPRMIEKAKTNRFYSVEMVEDDPPADPEKRGPGRPRKQPEPPAE